LTPAVPPSFGCYPGPSRTESTLLSSANRPSFCGPPILRSAWTSPLGQPSSSFSTTFPWSPLPGKHLWASSFREPHTLNHSATLANSAAGHSAPSWNFGFTSVGAPNSLPGVNCNRRTLVMSTSTLWNSLSCCSNSLPLLCASAPLPFLSNNEHSPLVSLAALFGLGALTMRSPSPGNQRPLPCPAMPKAWLTCTPPFSAKARCTPPRPMWRASKMFALTTSPATVFSSPSALAGPLCGTTHF